MISCCTIFMLYSYVSLDKDVCCVDVAWEHYTVCSVWRGDSQPLMSLLLMGVCERSSSSRLLVRLRICSARASSRRMLPGSHPLSTSFTLQTEQS